MKNLILILLLLSSCKAYRPIDTVTKEIPKEERSKMFVSRQLDQISPGDSLEVKMKDGNTYLVIYQLTKNDSLNGLFWKKNLKNLKVPIESAVHLGQIEALKIKHFSWGATAGLTGGVLLGLGVIGYFATQSFLTNTYLSFW